MDGAARPGRTRVSTAVGRRSMVGMGPPRRPSRGGGSTPRPATSGVPRVPLRRLVTSDLQGPGAWDEDRFRAGVPAHRNESVLDGCDHAAAGDGADLLGLNATPVADIDH